MKSRRGLWLTLTAAVAVPLLCIPLLASCRQGTTAECNLTTTTTSLVVCLPTTTLVQPACPYGPPAYVGTGPKVAVIGDSITKLSTPNIVAALNARGFSASVLGMSGYNTLTAAQCVKKFVDTNPAVVILEFGTNDVSGVRSGTLGMMPVDFQARMVDFKSWFPTACVAATTIQTHRDAGAISYWQSWDNSAQMLDNVIEARFPGRIVRWNEAAWAQTQLGIDVFQPRTDGSPEEIHPNADVGRPILAGLDADMAVACGV